MNSARATTAQGPAANAPCTQVNPGVAFHERRRTPWWRYALGAMAGALVLLVAAELLVRAGEWHLLRGQSDRRVWSDRHLSMLLPAEGFLWRMPPGPETNLLFPLNEMGYRGDPPFEREPGSDDFVVFAFGDSNVIGLGAVEEGMWTTIMVESLARKTDRPVRVHSFAQVASTLEHAIVEARAWIPRVRPDAVVLGVGAWNDYQRFHDWRDLTEQEAVERNLLAGRIAIANSPLQRSGLFRLWRRVGSALADARHERQNAQWFAEGVFAEDALGFPRRVPPDRFRELLREFVAICEENGTTPFFFTPRLATAALESRPEDPTEADYPIIQVYDRILREVAEYDGAKLIDTRQLLLELAEEHGAEAIWWDWVHWTLFANKQIGEEAARVVGAALVGSETTE